MPSTVLVDMISKQWPDGAFAPSETFSSNLPVPISARPRSKRSGRGECPVPPRLMGQTPSGLSALIAMAYPVLFGETSATILTVA